MARLGRGYWQSAVNKFDKSELSQEAFCEAHGLRLGTFRSWLYRLRREGGSSTPTFVERHHRGDMTVLQKRIAIASVVREHQAAMAISR